jgi:hypothetical protein
VSRGTCIIIYRTLTAPHKYYKEEDIAMFVKKLTLPIIVREEVAEEPADVSKDTV